MKNLLLLFVAVTLYSNFAAAQTTRTLKKVSEFKMPKEAGDDMAGANGATIIWHPGQNKYYAAMAGNAEFPLAIFDVNGKRLFDEDDELTTRIDMRGLWYNPQKKTIYGNGYSDNGWFHYELDTKGMVTDISIDIAEMKQPNAQSVGTYNPQTNDVLFLDGNMVLLYSSVGSSNGGINMRFGLTKKDGAGKEFEVSSQTPEDYNSTTVIYTGIKNAELGMLNIDKGQIELYNAADGFLTTVLKIPDGQMTYGFFNFAYANGMYWLFDKETRLWTSYK